MKQEQSTQERQAIRLEGMEHFFLPFQLFSVKGELLYFNPAAKRHLSGIGTDLIGKSVFELYPDVVPANWNTMLEKLKAAGNQTVSLSENLLAANMIIDGTLYLQLVIQPGRKDIEERKPEFVNKRQFKKLYNNSEHFISLLDTKGILLDLNDRALSIDGYSEKALGQHLWQTLSDSKLNKEHLEEAIHKAANGLSATFQAEMSRQDGSKVLMEFVLKPVNNKSGKINYILSEGKELIEHQNIRRHVLKGEDIYRRIGRSLSKGGILIADRSLKYILAEGSIFTDLGFDMASDMENKTLDEIHEPRTLKLLKPAFERALLGQTRSFEATARNGRIYSINIQPIYNESGEIEHALLCAFDIYDKAHSTKKLEQEIEEFRQSENLYRMLARSLPGGLFVIFDKDIRYLLIEGQGMETLGLKKDKVEGNLLKELDPVSYKDGLHYYRQALEGKTVVFEKKYEDKNVWFNWIFQPVYDDAGEIQGGMIIGSDINKLKEAEERYNTTIKELREANNQLKIENGVRQLIQKNLQEQTKELEQKNQELEQFAYVASHDLQEPLRMVSSYTQLLQSRYKDKLDDGADEFISYAIEGASRMQNLINDLLFYSRVGRKEMSFEKINLSIVLQLVMRNLAILIEETDAEIIFNHLPFVNADASQMVQLFQNLISNAIKFRKKDERSRIEINYQETDKFFVICVKDNGIGLGMEYKDRIFQIFQRLHTRDKYPGTGIGLAICKKIVERHGGEIWVESELGYGTTFCFTLQKQ